MPRVFHTGVGLPPFELVFSSTVYTIMPPDKPWKKVKEEYVIEQGTRLNGEPFKRTGLRWKWEPDEARKGKRCINHLDLTEEQLKLLLDQRRRNKLDYLKTEQELGHDMTNELDREIEKHAVSMEALKAERFALQKEIEEFKKQHEELKELLATKKGAR